jgi:general stress protein YciG
MQDSSLLPEYVPEVMSSRGKDRQDPQDKDHRAECARAHLHSLIRISEEHPNIISRGQDTRIETVRVIVVPVDRDKERRAEIGRKIHAREETVREVIPSIIRDKDLRMEHVRGIGIPTDRARERRAECAREAPHSMDSAVQDRIIRMGIVKVDRAEIVR